MTPLTITRPPAASGLQWIKQGWEVFKKSPVPWMGMTALVFMVVIGISLIPLVGRHLIELLSPFLVAGYFAASRAAANGEPATYVHLGSGLKTGRDTLLRIGVFYMLGSILIFFLVGLITGGDLHDLLQKTQNPTEMTPELANEIVTTAMPALLLASVLFTPLIMATWFAPGLALFDHFPPQRALWWSLWACWVNWRPLLFYSLMLGMFGFVAILIPFGLGMLVFLPVTLISTYFAYRELFAPVESDVA